MPILFGKQQRAKRADAIAGFVVFPLAVLFPFIYLFMEGFSVFYFGLWAVGLIGMYLVQKDEEEVSKSE